MGRIRFSLLWALQLPLLVGVDLMSKQMLSLCFFLFFFKKRGGILNGSQQAMLLNQPPRTLHHLARHLVLDSLHIWLGDISWESGSLPSTLKKAKQTNKLSLNATYQGRAWYAPFLAGVLPYGSGIRARSNHAITCGLHNAFRCHHPALCEVTLQGNLPWCEKD